MKKFKDLKQAKKELTKIFENPSPLYRRNEASIIFYFLDGLNHSNRTKDTIGNALIYFENKIRKLDNYRYKYKNERIMIDVSKNSNHNNIESENRLYQVGDDILSFFEIFELTDAHIENFKKILKENSMLIDGFSLFYFHYLKNNNINAINDLLEYFSGLSKETDDAIILINSDRPDEIVPIINFYGNKGTLKKAHIEMYLEAIANLENDKKGDITFNKKVYKDLTRKFSKNFKKATNISILKESNNKINAASLFDKLEASLSFRDEILRNGDYFYLKNIFKALIKTNPARLEKILAMYMNEIFGSRNNRKTFITFYNKIRTFYEDENCSFNLFLLNEKLQSYILLNELS